MKVRTRITSKPLLLVLVLIAVGWGAVVILGSGTSEDEIRASRREGVASSSDSGAGGDGEAQGAVERRRVDLPEEDRNSREEKPGVEPDRRVDEAAIRQAILKVSDSIQKSRLEFAQAVKAGEPASKITFLRNILERMELGLAKIRRGEYVVVPAAEAMRVRYPGDPDSSAYPTSVMEDGSVLYLKVVFSSTEADDLAHKDDRAGKQRWIEASAEIASHNKMSLRDRKARVLQSDDAKKKMARMRKASRKKTIPDLGAYMRELHYLRDQELPWYFSIERVGYTASMPNWARKFFGQLGGR